MALKEMTAVNWKTTVGSVLSVIGLGLIIYAAPKFMGADVSIADLVNDPRFSAALGVAFSALGSAIVGLMSRDFNKSSAASGISAPEKQGGAVSADTEAKIADRFGEK